MLCAEIIDHALKPNSYQVRTDFQEKMAKLLTRYALSQKEIAELLQNPSQHKADALRATAQIINEYSLGLNFAQKANILAPVPRTEMSY